MRMPYKRKGIEWNVQNHKDANFIYRILMGVQQGVVFRFIWFGTRPSDLKIDLERQRAKKNWEAILKKDKVEELALSGLIMKTFSSEDNRVRARG